MAVVLQSLPSACVARWIHSSATAYDGFNNLTRPALNAGLVLILLFDAALLGGITTKLLLSECSVVADSEFTLKDLSLYNRFWLDYLCV